MSTLKNLGYINFYGIGLGNFVASSLFEVNIGGGVQFFYYILNIKNILKFKILELWK